MHEVITTLLRGRGSVDVPAWRGLWERLDAGELDRAEIAALLATLCAELPDRDTLVALVVSLRRPAEPVLAGAVNIVGTGGGPGTFNISTAAAFTAAAMGVPVVKTGSRAYTGAVGSIDLLERLGVRLTKSPAETVDALGRFGIAFTGPYVYPLALTRMARTLVPLAMRPFGRFLNAIGPFLAAVPVTAQVTGVSAAAPLARLRELSAVLHDRRIWLCANDQGADELLGFAHNVIHPNDGTGPISLSPGVLAAGTGGLADLAPATEVTTHFLDVLAGKAGAAATEAVCLNAAALAVAGGRHPTWPEAYKAAETAIHDGAARSLADRLRTATAVLRG
ncbi:anthranilate phosphoribosyltransferase [Actinokineospora alba]|uniref:Anthranilate phosphoribosyltransferase n=1 Tax=Actinokineospora alba TaxID=504798 RepID=A0A1H0M7Q9_9PSEU|nr:hypothetical protein [Actinokineospora alba]TDP67621.1 anthranilate phosphoribosyltransferase [Actinokineospora alba]SDI44325.1 anthranilate phosphoribosyltransferase [Actinokineospora alba]SDO76518.1 anthranilate phosphoribosyltransferase [Actinokineospora alba]